MTRDTVIAIVVHVVEPMNVPVRVVLEDVQARRQIVECALPV